MRRPIFIGVISLILIGNAFASVFGTVRGIVHDPKHRPIGGITMVLSAKDSNFTMTASTDAEGQFHFDAVPLGEYTVAVSDPTFVPETRTVTVLSGSAPILHFELHLATQNESVTVSANSASEQTESVTPTNLVNREEIRHTPGATRSTSVTMITNYVPGAYVACARRPPGQLAH